MIFNYDKESGKLGGNSENLKKSWQDIKDFFTKKQDVVEKYNLSKNEQNAFAAIKDRLSTAILSEDSDNNRSLIADVMAEFTGADSALVKFAQDTEVTQISQENFVKSQEKVIQGTTKFRAALTSVGSVIKSVGASMLNMGIAMVASWAIGKVFEGIDYLYHYDENIIKAGQEAKDSIDSTVKSLQDSKQSLMDLGSSFGDQTDQIKTTGDLMVLIFVINQEIHPIQILSLQSLMENLLQIMDTTLPSMESNGILLHTKIHLDLFPVGILLNDSTAHNE